MNKRYNIHQRLNKTYVEELTFGLYMLCLINDCVSREEDQLPHSNKDRILLKNSPQFDYLMRNFHFTWYWVVLNFGCNIKDFFCDAIILEYSIFFTSLLSVITLRRIFSSQVIVVLLSVFGPICMTLTSSTPITQ